MTFDPATKAAILVRQLEQITVENSPGCADLIQLRRDAYHARNFTIMTLAERALRYCDERNLS